MSLHELKKLDNDLGGRAEDDLALALLFGVVDALQSIAKNTSSDHLIRQVRR